MQSLRSLKRKSNWFGFVTFIAQESRSLTVVGAIFCILYKEPVKSALPWEFPHCMLLLLGSCPPLIRRDLFV